MSQNLDDLAQKVAAIRWFHSIDLGNGIVTPGGAGCTEILPYLHLPADLRGQTVLDVGAWDGFYSFAAERRGADRVLATDHYCWGGEGWGTQDGFNLARQALNSKVEDLEIDVLDINPQAVGVFDIVLCLGVLYHMRHPLLALERIASVTDRQLILETHVEMLECERPAGAFYPGRELDDDPTNWWGLNPPAIEAMLKDVGFKEVRAVASYHHAPMSPSPVRQVASGLKARVLRREPFFPKMAQQKLVRQKMTRQEKRRQRMTRARMVFHAFR